MTWSSTTATLMMTKAEGPSRECHPSATAIASRHHLRRPSKPREEAVAVYPSPFAVARHTILTITRVATICTLLTHLLHPLYVAGRDFFGVSDTVWLLLCGLGLHSAMIFGYIGFFALCELRGWLQQYRIDRIKHNDAGFFWRALQYITVFHFGIRLVVGVALAYAMPYPPADAPLMGWTDTFLHWALNIFFGEFFSYWFHRCQHEVSWLYRRHKQHHEFRATEVVATEYASMEELLFYVVLNYVSTVHRPPIFHMVTILWKLNEAFEGHSGYSFRGTWLSRVGLLNSYRAEFHDFHHSHNCGAYGLHLYMDYLCGTCDEFLRYQAKRGRPMLEWG